MHSFNDHYYQLLRSDFRLFMAKCFAHTNPATTYLPNWHIDLIGEYLAACQKGEITRLIVNMPPRMCKSLTVSVAWPAWLLGNQPSTRIMAASYSQRLSLKHALDCRHIMQSDWYAELFPQTRIVADQNEKHKCVTTERGQRFATSVLGTATGEGGDVLIVDDPLNPLQAASRTAREAVHGWFDQTFASRLDDKKRGVIVLVMQRLHADDLSGYLLEKGGWEQLCLPAVAPHGVSYKFGRVMKERAQGELLHEAREDAEGMERAKRELGSHAFAAQYQQNPLAEEGGMIKLEWFGRY